MTSHKLVTEQDQALEEVLVELAKLDNELVVAYVEIAKQVVALEEAKLKGRVARDQSAPTTIGPLEKELAKLNKYLARSKAEMKSAHEKIHKLYFSCDEDNACGNS
ncbi:hypothetical protein ACFE04_021179 [Oxalis oulophora]